MHLASCFKEAPCVVLFSVKLVTIALQKAKAAFIFKVLPPKMKAVLFSSKHNASKRLIGNTIFYFTTIFQDHFRLFFFRFEVWVPGHLAGWVRYLYLWWFFWLRCDQSRPELSMLCKWNIIIFILITTLTFKLDEFHLNLYQLQF